MNQVWCQYSFTIAKRLSLYASKLPKKSFHPLRPRQHPKHWLTKDIQIHKAEKPVHYVNEPLSVPKTLYVNSLSLNEYDVDQNVDQLASKIILTKNRTVNPAPDTQKFLAVSIVGSPNCGKSTFLNKMVGAEVSAVSNKSNTTSEAIIGVHTNYDRRVQIEFKDTPGITKRYKYSRHFVSKAWDQIYSSDLILYMVDAVKTLEDSTRMSLKRLNAVKNEKEESIRKVLVFNKMDICFNKRKLRWLLTELEDLARFDRIFHISALTGFGMDELKQYLYENAIDSEWRYPDNVVTSQHPIDHIQQMVKSAIFKRFIQTFIAAQVLLRTAIHREHPITGVQDSIKWFRQVQLCFGCVNREPSSYARR